MSALIEVRNLSKIYQLAGVSVLALKDINLSIEAHEFISIIGPSGCGKSTLMHLLGLLDRPSSGTILFKGRDVSFFSEDERASFRSSEIGFVFQQFNLLQRVSSLENVLLPTIYARALPRQNFLEKVRELLSEVGLAHRLTHKPNQLSGGEQQRVAIARALINDPSLVLADEPTGNLDSRSGKEILEILGRLNRQGRTIVIVTHDPEIATICQRTIRLKDGELISS